MGPARNEDPINILSLDGGGIRGVSELVILHDIMLAIKERDKLEYLPKPCDYFDLIAGTSTGGLVAIMLGRLKMTTTEALDEYDNFAKNIFSFRNRRVDVKIKFGDKALQRAVESIVSKRGSDDIMLDPHGSSERCKTFVCAMPTLNQGDPILFRSYDIEGYPFRTCKIWEAARATSAAPHYFKQMSIKSDLDTVEYFIDAAIGCNNPAAVALKEASEIFNKSRRIGCIVSLGTGTKSKNLEQSSMLIKYGIRLFNLLKESTCDTETVHRRFKSDFTDFPHTYFRFNVPGGAEDISLGEWRKIPMLKAMTTRYLEVAAKEEVLKAADVLRKHDSEGITLGQACDFDKGQLILSDRVACPRGVSSRLFTGRREVLERLGEVFHSRPAGSGPRREFLMYGMGGVGKTQIALKFGETHADNFKHMFWVDATDSITLDQSFASIGLEVMGPQAGSGGRGTTKQVLNWLSKSKDEWFIVFDSCDDLSVLDDYVPNADRGNILYTSRDNSLRQRLPRGAEMEISELKEDEAITLFLKAARQPPEARENRKLAKPIVTELGCLPLAIDQAGSYCFMTNTALDKYEVMFREQKREILRETRFEGANSRNSTVYASFDVSYNAIRALARGQKHSLLGRDASSAIRILNLICFYHYQGIMGEIFQRAAVARHRRNRGRRTWAIPLGSGEVSIEPLVQVKDNGKWDNSRWKAGMQLLERLSLVKKDDMGNFTMHVLAHGWARDRMDKTDARQQALDARTLLYDSLPSSKYPDDLIYNRKVMPHLMACQEIEERNPRDDIESFFNYKAATPLIQAGQFNEAEVVLKRALALNADEMDGDGYPSNSVQTMEFLAELYEEQARFGEAEPLRLQVLERTQAQYSDLAESTIEAKKALAELYQLLDPDKAEAYYEQVVDALEQKYAHNLGHIDVVRARKRLAYWKASEAGEEIPLQEWEELYHMAVEEYGAYSRLAMGYKGNIARSLMNDGRFAEAEDLLVELYKYNRNSYGQDHPETAQSMCDSAEILVYQGLYVLAEWFAGVAFIIFKRVLGETHPKAVRALSLSGMAIAGAGHYEEAARRLRQCLELARNSACPLEKKIKEYEEHLQQAEEQEQETAVMQSQFRWNVLLTRKKRGAQFDDILETFRERWGFSSVEENDFLGRLPMDHDMEALFDGSLPMDHDTEVILDGSANELPREVLDA
ncbi:uncharacterized protein E0L32_003664 [Thyridium curvatum]|uniref:PNPLA domain-containing protein n=1 Tax=Thyridium curvatum TaxID=1093900 RepID=A0A507BB03_9PEZI|nr:uncharacterized protein E0L32_003664 [Thyridium curvatum]TPX16723.1 hypothetical protein E0L32_003664 [Thyridium curvatum]